MIDEFIQLQQSGRLGEAETGYRELLQTHPDNARALHLLGILRGQRGDLAEAVQLVLRASELDPGSAACQYTLGEMRMAEGRLDEAAQAYQHARMLDPNLAAAHSGLGQLALLKRALADAESHFKVALRADADDVQALAGLGQIAHARGDSQRSMHLLSQAAELAPHNPDIQFACARVMLDQGLFDFAAKALDNALTARPDFPLARMLRADVHVHKGEIAAALPMLQSLLARGEQVPAVRVGLGDIARRQGQLAEAITQYDEALRVQPNFAFAAIRRAETQAAGGRLDTAIEPLRDFVARHADAAAAQVALASLLAQAGQVEAAVQCWQAITARWPDDVDLKARHALALDQLGRHTEAQAVAETASGSPRPALAMLRARAALLAGEPAAAIQRLQRIDASKWAGLPTAMQRRRWRLLGLGFDALEQWPEALHAFIEAHRVVARPLPGLPTIDAAAAREWMRQAALPELAAGIVAAPVLLCGLPGSGVGRVAALLADQPGWFVRRDRFDAVAALPGAAPGEPPFDDPDPTRLGLLARRYRRAEARVRPPAATRVVDWVPWLDPRELSALKRALPGVKLLIVERSTDDMLLNWLGFGWTHGLTMPDPLVGAQWLRHARQQQALAARLLPSLRLDTESLFGKLGGAQCLRLAEFLGCDEIRPGPLVEAASRRPGGLPVRFASGHAACYRELLFDAFALLADDKPYAER